MGVCPRGPGLERVSGIIGVVHSNNLIVCPASAICTVNYSTLGIHTIRGVYRLGNIGPRGDGLSVVYCSLSGLDRCTGIDGTTFGLVGGGLPNTFAFVLPADDRLPGVCGGEGRMKVHIPSGGVVHALMQRLKGPVLAVSLRSGSRVVRCDASPRLVRRGCRGLISVIVSNNCKNARTSAIVGYAASSFRVVHRKGKRLVCWTGGAE